MKGNADRSFYASYIRMHLNAVLRHVLLLQILQLTYNYFPSCLERGVSRATKQLMVYKL